MSCYFSCKSRLDILVYGDVRIEKPGLQVPHPRIAGRAFVLKPLADLDQTLKISGKSVDELLKAVPHDDIELAHLPENWWYKD